MTGVAVRLPKQWKHWCRQAGLRPRDGRRGRWLYLRGRGREWRVNYFAMLQRGDTYAEFDRWALCQIAEAPIPKTRDQFVQTVEYLLRKDTP